jgi:hypothetical protein
MASGRSRTFVGSFIATGASISIAKVGFKPRAVVLINQNDPNLFVHIEGMADAAGFKQKGSASTYVTSNGVTLSNTGFTVGTDADINTDGERVWFIALE